MRRPALGLAIALGASLHTALEAARLTRYAQAWTGVERAVALWADATLAASLLAVLLVVPAWRGLGSRWLVSGAAVIGCLGAIASAWFIPAASSVLPVRPSPHERRTVVLVTGDTLRRDHVSAYADAVSPGLTPRLAALAAEGTLFEDAVTTAPLTLPSHTTLLSGLHPADHGVVKNGRVLPADLDAVPEALAASGFRVGGFPSSRVLHGSQGLRRWFHVYRDDVGGWPVARHLGLLRLIVDLRARWMDDADKLGKERGDRTIARALAWLDTLDATESVFLWVHLYDAHTPHTARPSVVDATTRERLPHPCDFSEHPVALRRSARVPFRPDRLPLPAEDVCRTADWSALNHQVTTYAAEVRFLDAQVGALIDGLKARGRWEEAGLIFVADHGESLVEHQHHVSHQYSLYDPVLRVPLIVRAPACADCPERVSTSVSTVRVAATLRWLAGLPSDDTIEGPHLLRPSDAVPLAVGPAPIDRASMSGPTALQVVARGGGRKVLRDASGHVERYDLDADPLERVAKMTAEERAAHDAVVEAWRPGGALPGLARRAYPKSRRPALEAALAQPGLRGAPLNDVERGPFEPLELRVLDILAAWRAEGGDADSDDLPDDLQRSLEALGYLH